MNKLFKGIRFFFNSEFHLKVKLIRMLGLLVKFSILVNHIPLRYYYRNYFLYSNNDKQPDLQPFLQDICYINRIGSLLPWKISCLIESLTTKEYLRKYGIDIRIKLGVVSSGELRAHAWYSPQINTCYNELKH